MATSGNIQSKKENNAIFPDFPRGEPITSKGDNLSDRWALALNSLFQALQKNYKPVGIMIPTLTTEQLDNIEQSYQRYIDHELPPSVPDISGQMAFDKTNGVRLPKIFVITYNPNTKIVGDASWKTFTIT